MEKPKTQIQREAFAGFQEALWETLLAAGKESLAKLDTALKAYENASEAVGDTLPDKTVTTELFSSIGEAIDEASAW